MVETKKHPNDWIIIHNPKVEGPDAKVQRKSFDAHWGVSVEDGGSGFKEGARPKKAGN